MIVSKSGFVSSVMVSILIAVIAGLVLLVILPEVILKPAGTLANQERCRQSVMLNRLTKIHVAGMTGDVLRFIVDRYGNRVELECSTSYLTVKDEDADVQKEKIARAMAECWSMYGEGREEIFDTSDNQYCAVCARMEFEHPQTLTGFTRYLAEYNVSPVKPVSYYEYMSGVHVDKGGISSYENEKIAEMDAIDTGRPLAVMFVMTKNAYPGGVGIPSIGTTFFGGVIGGTAATVGTTILMTGVEIAGISLCSAVTLGGCAAIIALGGTIMATTGGALGYVLGSHRTADWDAIIILWPYDEIKELNCTALESKSTPLEVKTY